MSALKAKLLGPTKELGISVIEVVVALAVMATAVTAAFTIAFGSQSLVLDAAMSRQAGVLARSSLEEVTAYVDYSQASTTAPVVHSVYSLNQVVPLNSVTQCGKDVQSRVSWVGERNRALTVDLVSRLGDVTRAYALGGSCDTTLPSASFSAPATFASSPTGTAIPAALSVFASTMYLGVNEAPFLLSSDISSAVYGQSSGLVQPYVNGFTAGEPVYDVSVARLSDGKRYAFLARATTTKQFMVVDVTATDSPVSVGSYSLANVSSVGSFPQGFRVSYYGGYVYITARETTGPELHVFDVSNPAAIHEVGGGTELNKTAEEFVLAEKHGRRYLFMASDSNLKELDVYDVTNPSVVTEVVASAQNLPGNVDGSTIFILDNRLYFGRLNYASGPELLVYDASDPAAGLPLLGSANVAANILGLSVSGQYVFMTTSKIGEQFQVWNSDPLNLSYQSMASPYVYQGIPANTLSYSAGRVYLASTAGSVRILHAP